MKFNDLPFVTKLCNPQNVSDLKQAKLGTNTFTEVKGEGTDKDPDYSFRYAPILGTETITKAKGEGTDSDYYSCFDPNCN